VASLTTGQKEEILTDLLLPGVNNLQNIYREVKKSNGLVFPFLVEGIDSEDTPFLYDSREEYENWTEDGGLVLTENQLLGSYQITPVWEAPDEYSTFRPFGFRDYGAETKSTNVFDQSADAVTFNPSAADTYFLIPTIPLAQGQHYTDVSSGGIDTRRVFLNLIYRFFPRLFDEPGAVIETDSGEMEAYTRAIGIEPTRTFSFDVPIVGDPVFSPGGDFFRRKRRIAVSVCGNLRQICGH
jgi:hypothetical protein